MLRLLPILLVMTACAQERRNEADRADAAASAAAPAVPAQAPIPAASPMTSEAMMDVPADRAQLDRLLAMGYTVHEDHMHKPGVAACPKMGADPVR